MVNILWRFVEMHYVLTIIFVIVFLFFLIKKNSIEAKIKGKNGEMKVALGLSTLPSRYRVINNMLINYNGSTTQVDHIVVSEYGIFVIETKNYKGWIYGSPNGEYWTQNLYGNKYQLHNPLLQNRTHLNALKKALDLNPQWLIPLIVFSRKATIKSDLGNSVIYMSQLRSKILSYNIPILTTAEVQDIYEMLLSMNIDSRENRKRHISNVKTNIYRKSQTIANGYCPQCGGKLILRQGKYGSFYGCCNYPNCKFTHPIE